MILWTLLIIFLIYLIVNLSKFYYHRYILSAIPSPPGHFFFGNLLTTFKIDADEIFTILRTYSKEYWPIYRFRTFYVTTINLLCPEDLEIVLSGMKHLKKSKLYDFLTDWLGEGLLTSSGEKWQTRRKILTPAFHFNILQQFLNIFNEETTKMVEQFKNNCDKPYINIVPYITQMTLQSIGETAMGLDNIDTKTQSKYREGIHKIGKLFLTRLRTPWLRLKFIYKYSSIGREERSVVDFLHAFSDQVIREREKKFDKIENIETSYSGRKKLAMLDLLLSAKKNEENIDYEGIREEVDTFMFEGHDTTAMALSFLLLCLACNKDVQMKVAQEIDEIIGLSSSKYPTFSDLQQLNYTERVIKETLRLYPSVPFISRIASEEFTTHTGYFIPKGTILHMHIFDLHRHPSIYENPEKFDPDRFLLENSKDRHPFAYLPFSAGPRNCIGQKFAMLELKSAICGILRAFTLEEVDKQENIKFYPDLVLRTRNEIRVKFIPR